ncbi:MAG: hypothetical protein PVJ76_16985 [Gemmatimonadota bacterium]
MRCFWKKTTLIFAFWWSQSLLLACTDTAGPPDPVIYALAISPEAASVSGIGTEVQLTATAVDMDGDTLLPTEVTWSTLNQSIALVGSNSGIVTTVASGQVVITAEAEGLVAHALLTVSAPGIPAVTSWTQTDLGFPITDVWGTASDNVFAVGGRSGEAEIAHFDGDSWTSMDPAGADETLWSVWGTSGTDVFAVGDGGTILHYDGAAWAPIESGIGGGLTGVWAAAPDAVVAVGLEGVWLFDGEAWSQMSEVAGSPWTVWGTSLDNLFYRGPGVTRGIWGFSPADVFAVGSSGQIWHFDGTSWAEMESGTDNFLLGVWGTSPTDVYAVGDKGTILHYDGTDWSPMDSGTDLDLFQIWGISPGHVFVVSRNGLVLRSVE